MGEVRLAIAIAHTPWDAQRRANIVEIQRRLGGLKRINEELVGFRVIQERRGPPVKGEKRSCWPTVGAAYRWLAQQTKATHVIELADDSLPCRDFIEGAKNAFAAKPEEIVNFFTMRRSCVEPTLAAGKHWFTSPDSTWGGMMGMPRAVCADFLDWERQHVDPEYIHDDGRLNLYLWHGIKKPIWVTVPSLLEHIDPGNSLLGHGNRMRVATAFLGSRSAATIDWSRGADDPVRTGGSLSFSAKAAYRP